MTPEQEFNLLQLAAARWALERQLLDRRFADERAARVLAEMEVERLRKRLSELERRNVECELVIARLEMRLGLEGEAARYAAEWLARLGAGLVR